MAICTVRQWMCSAIFTIRYLRAAISSSTIMESCRSARRQPMSSALRVGLPPRSSASTSQAYSGERNSDFMRRFFEAVVKPLLDMVAPARIVEIGAAEGANSALVARWCEERQARLDVDRDSGVQEKS